MVGTRHSRSKGCITCRQRRVKCDEGRPTCQRCRNGFFNCGGYAKGWLFRHDGTWLRSPAKPTGLPSSKGHDDPLSARPPLRPCSRLPSRSEPVNLPISLAIVSASRERGLAHPPLSSLSPPAALSLDPFKEEIVISHLLSKMFLQETESPRSDTDSIPWIMHLLPVLRQDRHSAQYLSILAVAVSFFARVHNDITLQNNGDRIYGQALRQLVDDMKSPSVDNWCLAAIAPLCLCIYELIRASGPLAWVQHSGGIAALIETIGPHAFQSVAAKEMFHLCRGLIIMGYISRQRRCFLERPEWKSIPFALIPEPRSLGSQLQDILCHIPGLFEDCHTFQKLSANGEPTAATSHARALHDRASATLRELFDLRWQWEDKFSHTCYQVIARRGSTMCVDDTGELLFTTLLFFENLERATEIANFDAMFIILYNILSLLGLERSFAHTGRIRPLSLTPCACPLTASPVLLPGQGTREEMASEICRLVDYSLRGKHQILGAFMLMFPLRVAYNNLGGDVRVKRWLEQVFRDIANSKGFEVGNHILDRAAVSSPFK